MSLEAIGPGLGQSLWYPYIFFNGFCAASSSTPVPQPPGGTRGLITYMSAGINVSSATAGVWVVQIASGSTAALWWLVNAPAGNSWQFQNSFIPYTGPTTCAIGWDSGSSQGMEFLITGYLIPI